MTLSRQIAAGLYGIAGTGSVLFGIAYLFSSEFMPYHAAAIGQAWGDLAPEVQTLFLALLDVAGACWTVAGLLILALIAGPFRLGARWARGLIPAALLLLYVPILNATLNVLMQTPSTPPWYGAALALTLTVLGVAFDRPWRDANRNALTLSS